MKKSDPLAYWRLPLYLYCVAAYSKFLTVGKSLDFPLIVHIQTQPFCNGRCVICPYSTVSKMLEPGIMEWDLFVKIANELASEPLLSKVTFQMQNEPLLDNRIFDCVKYLKSRNVDKMCSLVTNGELLDKFSLTDIVQSNLDSLIISINAHTKEMYQSINIGLDYDKVMQNIYRLLSNSSTKQKLMLSFVLIERNKHEVYQAVRYWNKKGIKTRVLKLVSTARFLDNYETYRPVTDYYESHFPLRFWRHLMSRLRYTIGCSFPFFQMHILHNGDVVLCCQDWYRGTVVGNTRTNSLREIWNSEKMAEIRRLMLRKRYERIDSCKECPMFRKQ
jgi:radical SAM protein with 4Fe4S-binding SPASM domain